ncbi:MAG: alkaline phosphatase family protein, partial [Rhodospirillaceae bacterium]
CRMQSVLPSLSRPAYESLHTGVAPVVHGVTSNEVVRMTTHPNVFSAVRQAGGHTAAAAYSWFAELYNGCPYDPVMDMEVNGGEGAIEHGRFYLVDPTPDSEVLRAGDRLIRTTSPDYMLIHPMGCDHMGHTHGGGSVQQRRAAAGIDDLLSRMLPDWRAMGYHVFVTSDHGMSVDGNHGGTMPIVREVAFYEIPPEGEALGRPAGADYGDCADQLSVAPTILDRMGVPLTDSMTGPVL